jgi:hypothetical protein
MSPDRPAVNEMHLAVEVLATHPGPIHDRLQAACTYFGAVQERKMLTASEELLSLRIGAGFVEGGDEDDASDLETEASDAEVAESIALLSEERVVEIARDMLLLYELMAGIRSADEMPELAKLKGLRVGDHGAI